VIIVLKGWECLGAGSTDREVELSDLQKMRQRLTVVSPRRTARRYSLSRALSSAIRTCFIVSICPDIVTYASDRRVTSLVPELLLPLTDNGRIPRSREEITTTEAYSDRSATRGSIVAARQAGTRLDNSAVAPRTKLTPGEGRRIGRAYIEQLAFQHASKCQCSTKTYPQAHGGETQRLPDNRSDNHARGGPEGDSNADLARPLRDGKAHQTNMPTVESASATADKRVRSVVNNRGRESVDIL
jgi:hypothetical protein